MRFFEAIDGHGEPTVFVEWHDSWRNQQTQTPVIQRCKVAAEIRGFAWPHIVRSLTVGPTIESARVVIETLNDEIKALREVNSELNCANSDLNRELTDLRRALT